MRRRLPEVSSGSMADIAFLLLIFFLVATTIEDDKGLLRKLPPDVKAEKRPMHERNIMRIYINANSEIMVNKGPVAVEDLTEIVMKFVNNRGQVKEWSVSPEKAVISLNTAEGAGYATYIMVQDRIAAAYHALRDEAAEKLYQQTFDELRHREKIHAIKKLYPMNISEVIGG
ncbi:biopolymer transporter ExbD [bacterium]|nr:biopolymer transporter ExbD [bacterium]